MVPIFNFKVSHVGCNMSMRYEGASTEGGRMCSDSSDFDSERNCHGAYNELKATCMFVLKGA